MLTMSSIFSLLGDPAWWFTAVFVATLIGLFTPFLGRRLDNLFSSLSERYRRRTARRRMKSYRWAVRVSRDATMMLLLSARTTRTLMNYGFMVTLFFCGQILIQVSALKPAPIWPNITPEWLRVAPENKLRIADAFFTGMLIPAGWLAYQVAVSYRLLFYATRAYTRRRYRLEYLRHRRRKAGERGGRQRRTLGA
jgi:hypothetical protein